MYNHKLIVVTDLKDSVHSLQHSGFVPFQAAMFSDSRQSMVALEDSSKPITQENVQKEPTARLSLHVTEPISGALGIDGHFIPRKL